MTILNKFDIICVNGNYVTSGKIKDPIMNELQNAMNVSRRRLMTIKENEGETHGRYIINREIAKAEHNTIVRENCYSCCIL